MVAFNPRTRLKLIAEAQKAFPAQSFEALEKEYDEMFALQYKRGAHENLGGGQYELSAAEKQRLSALEEKFKPRP